MDYSVDSSNGPIHLKIAEVLWDITCGKLSIRCQANIISRGEVGLMPTLEGSEIIASGTKPVA